MTMRKKRARALRRGLTAYKLAELLTGEAHYAARRYSGYAEVIDDRKRELEPSADMQADWKAHRDEIMQFWISGRYTGGLNFRLTPESDPIQVPPHVFIAGEPGTRPWAWWQFDAPEPLGDEDETAYLERHRLLLPEEREAFQ